MPLVKSKLSKEKLEENRRGEVGQAVLKVDLLIIN